MDYDGYWAERRGDKMGLLSDFQKKRARIVKKYLKDNMTIKDIGCGDGSILVYLSRRVCFDKMYGADVSEKALKHIEKQGLIPVKIDITKIEDIRHLPDTDYTVILEMLEHVPNPEEILLELIKGTKDKIVFSIPNTGFIGYRLRLLFGSFPLQWKFHPGEHLRFWTYSDIKWWLKELGLRTRSEIVLYEGVPVLNKLMPSLFSMGIIVVIDVGNNGGKIV